MTILGMVVDATGIMIVAEDEAVDASKAITDVVEGAPSKKTEVIGNLEPDVVGYIVTHTETVRTLAPNVRHTPKVTSLQPLSPTCGAATLQTANDGVGREYVVNTL